MNLTTSIKRVVLLAVLFTAGAQAQTRKDIPTITRDAKYGVVTIETQVNGKPYAQGSGFVIREDGTVVTNYHVIKTGDTATVRYTFYGVTMPVAGMIAADPKRDLAILKVKWCDKCQFPIHTLPLGNSDNVQVGEDVIAIGNPLGLGLTVSNGILSAKRLLDDDDKEFLQTTAPISHGSSGGPLLNMRGQVIGITSMFITEGENLNFAIPVNAVKELLLQESVLLARLPNEPDPDVKVGKKTPSLPPPRYPQWHWHRRKWTICTRTAFIFLTSTVLIRKCPSSGVTTGRAKNAPSKGPTASCANIFFSG